MTRPQPQLPLFADRKRRAPPPLERSTHIAVADALRKLARQDVWWGCLPLGEFRTKSTALLLAAMGVRRGAADFMLLSPGPAGVCFLELKRPPNKLTKDQEDFRDAALAAGAQFEVAYSFDEAIALLSSWGVLRPGLNFQ